MSCILTEMLNRKIPVFTSGALGMWWPSLCLSLRKTRFYLVTLSLAERFDTSIERFLVRDPPDSKKTLLRIS